MTDTETRTFQSRIIELLESINWELEQAREFRNLVSQYPTRVEVVSHERSPFR